jgi:hypothetical protein
VKALEDVHVAVVDDGIDWGKRQVQEIVSTLVDRVSLWSRSLMQVKRIDTEDHLHGGDEAL